MNKVRELRDELPRSKPRSILGIVYNYIYYYRYYNKLIESNHRLRLLKDKHSGEKGFIIATGPSLGKTDFKPIKDNILIGVNDLYRLTEELGIEPTYWVLASPDQRMQKEVLSRDYISFFSGNAGRKYLSNPLNEKQKPIIVKNFKEIQVWKEIKSDITNGLNGGKTVVEYAIQVALHLGLKEIGLIGCDCGGKHYKEEGYITKDYNGWEMDWGEVINSYRICKKYLDENLPDRTIINYTVGGNLEVFERRKTGE